LLCEARYQAKGTQAEIAFWQERRSELTESELRRGQGAIGSVSTTLSQVNDSIIVKRCEEFKSVWENPDDVVDDRSPELQAASERVQTLIPVMLDELIKSGFDPSYINDILGFGVEISNVVESDLVRATWIESYFQKVIFGLREQSKTLPKTGAVSSALKDWPQWAAVCAKGVASDYSDDVTASIQNGEFEAATDHIQISVLLERLSIFTDKAGLKTQDGLSVDDLSDNCEVEGSATFDAYIDAPAKIGRIEAAEAIAAAKE